MPIKLPPNIIPTGWQTALLSFLFIVIRLASFLTYQHPLLNQIIAAALILGFAYLCQKKLSLAWVVLIAEFIFDGSGHFFEFFNFILRTWFLGLFAAFWLLQKIKERKLSLPKPRHIFVSYLLLCATLLLSITIGFKEGHATMNILQDAILYFFILLLFPAIDVKSNLQHYFPVFFKAFIIGSTLFSTLTLFLYSSGIKVLGGNYYHWFRDIAGGKITDLGSNFFRIVLPEHLCILPIILIVASKIMKDQKNKALWFYLLCSSAILTLNFTRIYFIALAVGLVVLIIKNLFINWLKISLIVGSSVFVLFSLFFFICSRGQSLGINVLTGRASGIVSPTSDISSVTRMALLPDILKTLKKHPILGSGLGATVTYFDPIYKKQMIRTQFDWGYLEMLAELGAIGLVIFLAFLIIILQEFTKLIYNKNANDFEVTLYRGLLAGALSFFVVNITTPALFYGFGILYFVLLLTLVQNKTESTKI